MTVDLTGLCQEHSFETAENICRRCGLEYCELCLVFPFGAKKPFCKECAMVAGGVRSHAARAEMTKRDIKRRVKAWGARNAGRQSAGAAAEAADSDPVLSDPLAPTEDDLQRVPSTVPANGGEFATERADGVNEVPPPAPMAEEKPADGVAPPIDWSQPFG